MAGPTTSWARLEPSSRDPELAPGLEARIADPLWLLGRQWQFGEFVAADGGSAITTQITASVAMLKTLRPGRAGLAASHPYSVGPVPLEALVEAEDPGAVPTLQMRVRAGQQFERLLTAAGVGRHLAAYRTAYPIESAGLFTGRSIDGARLHAALAKGLPSTPAIPPADVAAVTTAARNWLTWAESLAFAPPEVAGGPASWLNDRMEYAFGLSATDGLALEAEEYTDGTLDWHSFTASGTADPAQRTSIGPLSVVPTAVGYPGMPASRLWEFEDAQVDFGAVDAQPEDLGRLLLAGFALVYGADWLLVPLELPTGALARITRFDVRDTFGQTSTIGPTDPTGAWGMFGITRPDTIHDPALLLAPALNGGLQGGDIEEVLLLRDEMANLAWALEQPGAGPAAPAVAVSRPEEGTLEYRLRSDPPQNWFPLLPQRDLPSNPQLSFRLALLDAAGPRPGGRLLAPLAADPRTLLREEEVPREGARLSRAYQLARWIDGSTYLWLGRRKGAGRGEGSSGLRFDLALGQDDRG
jgi:hypothetical protein